MRCSCHGCCTCFWIFVALLLALIWLVFAVIGDGLHGSFSGYLGTIFNQLGFTIGVMCLIVAVSIYTLHVIINYDYEKRLVVYVKPTAPKKPQPVKKGQPVKAKQTGKKPVAPPPQKGGKKSSTQKPKKKSKY
ncbi:hypothetical protein BLNAU_211 [Blattamonas nauphoetae]|uniref:Uncharacterized protein n=1 Tax=Blattamonas nauphoetae TaxID=2049346 RepID=A0ABQ9YMN8_9EUKA|nr:hypothetical protein BLNAU_211 [Blattamonas nauphoetae]